MYFQKGDWFEVSGKGKYAVNYANEDFFICSHIIECPVRGVRGVYEWVSTGEPLLFSNKREDFDKMYWIIKIPAQNNVEPPSIKKICWV